MHIPSNATLVKIAIYVGVAGVSSIMYVRYKIQERIRNAEYFRAAMTELRKHSGAINLLGEPIKDTGFDLGDQERNYCNGQKAQFEVSVKGSKDTGKIYFWATRNVTGWLLDRLELQVKTQPNKRFLLKKVSGVENEG